jgi:hypothetical protein
VLHLCHIPAPANCPDLTLHKGCAATADFAASYGKFAGASNPTLPWLVGCGDARLLCIHISVYNGTLIDYRHVRKPVLASTTATFQTLVSKLAASIMIYYHWDMRGRFARAMSIALEGVGHLSTDIV